MSVRAPGGWATRPAERVEQRLSIERDGAVVVRSGKVEYGQGIRTGFAKIVAAALHVPIERVRVELGETDRVPWDMGTFGSLSTATDGPALHAAAVYAGMLLRERASAQFGVPASELALHNGSVVTADGRAIAYEALVSVDALTGVVPDAGRGDPDAAPIDDAPLRLDGRDIVTGRARYPADVRLPRMRRGHVLHPPQPGARLVALDERAARALPGVLAVVRDGDFVGTVAERDEQALAAVRALEAEWSLVTPVTAAPIDVMLQRDAGVEAAFATAGMRLEGRYHVPHVAHASISPSAAVADVRDDGVDVYVATQRPFGLRDEVAKLLGRQPGTVHVHPQAMSGMYGRGNIGDATLEAVRLSRAVSQPVLVQWTRAEEFRLSPHRPTLDADLQAALDAAGQIVGWRYSARTNPHLYVTSAGVPNLTEMTAGRNAVPPYRLGSAEVVLHVEPAAVRTAAFRSLAAAPNVFAIESFVDEVAHASRQDPIAFRLRHADDARLRRVLETVSARSRWDQRPRDAGRGFGVACAVYHGTYVAEVAEVTVAVNGRARLERVWCAVDAGRLVHPDGARNQIEGGVQQAASWTLLEELRQHEGEITTTSWREYPIATCQDAPREIDVVFTFDPRTPSTGVGEPGSVPTAAAIANAVWEACGVRVRRLPLTPEALAAGGVRESRA